MATQKKVGALSNEEIDFIKSNIHKMSLESIAKALHRTVEAVMKVVPGSELRVKLMRRYYWDSLKEQFVDKSEEDFFIASWCEIIDQFRDDVKPTEEQQIKDLILSDIYKNRASIARTRELRKQRSLEQEMEKQMALPDSMRDMQKIQLLQTDILNTKTAIIQYTSDTEKYSKISNDLNKSLKATRDQRFSKVESGNKTFLSIINDLYDEEKRIQEGREAELLKLAIDKKTTDLYEYHQYDDGEQDLPIYSVDSLDYQDKKEEED